jgi:hypothetical protein
MPRKALSKEEQTAKRRQENQRYISNAEMLEKKRERDRVRKQEKRRRSRLMQQDPLALLADVAAQKAILNDVNEEEEEDEEIIDPLAESEEIVEDNGPVEQEDGSIMIGFRDNNWNSGEEEEQGTIIY